MDTLITWLLLVATRGLGLLPLTAQRALGRLIGTLACWTGRRSAQITRENIDLCFPELDIEARHRLVRDSLTHTAQLMCELGIVFHWPTERWQPLIRELRGAELIDAAVARGRPVLLLVPHFGNWEFLSLFLGRYAVSALYDPPRFRALEPLILQARSRAGARLLPIDAGGLRDFFQNLRDGGVAALLPDQVPEQDAGVHVPFFGQPALTMTFAHRIAMRTDALLVLGSARRVPGGFALAFQPLDPAVSDSDSTESAAAMNRAIEALVREDPAQYQWEYKRFKRPPPGMPSPYARD